MTTSGERKPRTPLSPLSVVRRKPAMTEPAEKDPHNALMGCSVYRDGRVVEQCDDWRHAAQIAREQDGFVWLGLFEPEEGELNAVAAEFDLHPLPVEDAMNTHNRPKLERYDNMLFMVLKTARYVEHDELTAESEVVRTSEVMVFIGSYFAITVRHGNFGEFSKLRNRLENEDRELLALGPAAVLYAISDVIVDRYLDVCSEVETDLDELEESVFSPRSKRQDVDRIYQLKRELLELRRAIAPLAVPLQSLAHRPLPLVPKKIRNYFRDVEDHLTRVRETVNGLDELLTSILQAQIARLSLSENEDMRKITSWAAIFAVPTAIAGIYGMNFDFMPELHWRFGYPLVIAVIVVICLLLYRGFKRSGWL